MLLNHPLSRSVLDSIDEVKTSLREVKKRLDIHFNDLERVMGEVFDQLTKVDCNAVQNNLSYIEEKLKNINEDSTQELFRWTQDFNDQEQKRQKQIKNVSCLFYYHMNQWQRIIDSQLMTKDYFLNELQEFNLTNKADTISIQGSQIAIQSITTTYYAFVSVGKPLDLSQVQSIRFKILSECGDLGIGLLDLDVMQQKAFRPTVITLPNGAYVLFQDRYILHNDLAQINWKTQGFAFTTNDIIQITFDPHKKSIEWIKEGSDCRYAYPFTRTDAILTFCAVFKPQGCSVQII